MTIVIMITDWIADQIRRVRNWDDLLLVWVLTDNEIELQHNNRITDLWDREHVIQVSDQWIKIIMLRVMARQPLKESDTQSRAITVRVMTLLVENMIWLSMKIY